MILTRPAKQCWDVKCEAALNGAELLTSVMKAHAYVPLELCLPVWAELLLIECIIEKSKRGISFTELINIPGGYTTNTFFTCAGLNGQASIRISMVYVSTILFLKEQYYTYAS